MKPALLLIDLQNDYLGSSALQPPAGELIERARALLERCRAAAIPVIHVWTTVRPDPDRRMPHWQRAGRWSCVEGTEGHTTPLPPLPSESVVHKTFFSAFSDGRLDELLAGLGVDTLWLAGVQMQSCVRATALDAYQRGFAVELMVEAVGSEDPIHATLSRRYLAARISGSPQSDGAPGEAEPARVAAAAARAAWPAWRDTPIAGRVDVLERLAGRIDVAEWTESIAQAVRKPARHARAEAARTVALIRAALRPAELEAPCGPRSRRRYRPRGVLAIVTPWNNPLAIPVGRLVPALLYGNAVVWKPSPLAAGLADRLAELIALPGLVTVLHGGADTAERLMADANVDGVVLTGSEAAGCAAQVICAQRHVPLQAELGGNNAAIVWTDADLAAAAAAVAEGAFGFAGQRCTANRRVIVERGILDDFLARLERAVLALSDVGPLVSPAQRDRVAALVARSGGVLFQGRAEATAAFFPPTVILCDDPTREIVQEETFGPVLVVQPAADFDHALALCNGVRQGLVAALFARAPALQARFLAEAEAGILKLNMTTADADAEAPFGGWKASGSGPPEHGVSNREVYTRTQAVYE